jgi:hypothetical protein
MVMDMEDCLKKSVEQYRAIVEHAAQLEGLLKKGDPELLGQYTQRLRELQGEASQHDQVFFKVFSQNSEDLKAHPLFIEREHLLQKIVKLNQLILPRIRGMMAVTAHELKQAKTGRTVVAGYRQPLPEKKQKAVRGIG